MKYLFPKNAVLALLVLLCCVTLSPVVRAEDPARNVNKQQADEARALFKEGVQAQRDGEWEKAYEALRKSYNLRRSFDTAANLGVVEVRLERYPAAAQHLDYWLRNYPTSEDPERYARVKAMFEQVRPQVGGVTIEVDAPGARIFIDNEAVGTAPIEHELFVPEGAHKVRAELKDKAASAEFDVEMGATAQVQLRLEEAPSVPTSGLDQSESQPNDEPSEPTQPRVRRNWVPAYILGGATVAAFGTSMVFRALSGSSAKKRDDASTGLSDFACADAGTAPPSCAEIDRYRTRANHQATLADATLIATAVFGAATLGYVIFTIGKNTSPEQPQAAVAVERGGVSFSLSGHF